MSARMEGGRLGALSTLENTNKSFLRVGKLFLTMGSFHPCGEAFWAYPPPAQKFLRVPIRNIRQNRTAKQSSKFIGMVP